jgi:hypothetical protein
VTVPNLLVVDVAVVVVAVALNIIMRTTGTLEKIFEVMAVMEEESCSKNVSSSEKGEVEGDVKVVSSGSSAASKAREGEGSLSKEKAQGEISASRVRF